MSVVSSIVLMVSISDSGRDLALENRLDAWLRPYGYTASFQRIDKAAGGHKYMQCALFAAAFGAAPGHATFPEDEFAAFIGGLPWENRANVVLSIKPEEGATRVWRFVQETWTLLGS